jgi:hypothetical protein
VYSIHTLTAYTRAGHDLEITRGEAAEWEGRVSEVELKLEGRVSEYERKMADKDRCVGCQSFYNP